MTELEAIRRYWNTRAEGYSLKTAYDLQHAEKVWLERLRPFVLASGKLDILDVPSRVMPAMAKFEGAGP